MTGDEESVGRPVEVARAELCAAARRRDTVSSSEGAVGHTALFYKAGSNPAESSLPVG